MIIMTMNNTSAKCSINVSFMEGRHEIKPKTGEISNS